MDQPEDAEFARRLAAIEASLATLESRVTLTLDQGRRNGEVLSRLLLRSDNARRLGLSHGETLLKILERLGGKGGGDGDGDNNAGPAA